jgi:hypothetical protein
MTPPVRFMQMRGRLANSVVAQRTKALFEDRQKVFFYGGALISPLPSYSGLLERCLPQLTRVLFAPFPHQAGSGSSSGPSCGASMSTPR